MILLIGEHFRARNDLAGLADYYRAKLDKNPKDVESIALLAVTVVVAGFALIPHGKWRTRWFAATAALVGLLAVSLMYLGTDHPSDVAIGWIIGPVVGILVFRWVAPESVYPVAYGRGRAAPRSKLSSTVTD